MKQTTPQTLDGAVAATLELESYLSPKLTVASVDSFPTEVEQENISAVSQVSNDKLATMLVNRFDKFEASYSQQEGNKPYSARGVRFTPRGYGRVQGNPPQR